MNKTIKKTAREIKLEESLVNNPNINIRIGTAENRDYPSTVYIYLSFWINPKKYLLEKEQSFLKRKLEHELKDIYLLNLKPYLSKNFYFPNEEDNIFIVGIPDNFNYNGKRNFISLELNLHTVNIFPGEKFPLSNKKQTTLFKEVIKVANLIGDSKVMRGAKGFDINKKSS